MKSSPDRLVHGVRVRWTAIPRGSYRPNTGIGTLLRRCDAIDYYVIMLDAPLVPEKYPHQCGSEIIGVPLWNLEILYE